MPKHFFSLVKKFNRNPFLSNFYIPHGKKNIVEFNTFVSFNFWLIIMDVLVLVIVPMYRARAQVIDFSIPYFHSGVSLLASPKTKSEIPLLAFLLPFSPELWIAIFTSLNITAVAVAVYEWLSPFGLNPWGRQRSKNFSLSSGELCKIHFRFSFSALLVPFYFRWKSILFKNCNKTYEKPMFNVLMC